MVNFRIFLLPLLLTPSRAQPLSVVYSSAKLPEPDWAYRLWYDGADTVYIIGSGGISDVSRSILRNIFSYSLSTERIQFEAFLPMYAGYGSVHGDSHGNIFYVKSASRNDSIIKYSISSKSSSVVGTIPQILLDNNTVLVLGRYPQEKEILSVDLTTGTTIILDLKLPKDVRYGAAVKWRQDKVYLFHQFDGVREWDLGSNTFKKMSIKLPIFNQFPTVVTNETWIYILSNFDRNREYQEGIFKIDPVAMTTQFLHVDNWPLANSSRYYNKPPQCVCVPKWDRIYCFGGQSANFSISSEAPVHDEIFYVDLNSFPNNKRGGLVTDQVYMSEIPSDSSTVIQLDSGTETTTEILASSDTFYAFICSTLPQCMNPILKIIIAAKLNSCLLQNNTSSVCILTNNHDIELDLFCQNLNRMHMP